MESGLCQHSIESSSSMPWPSTLQRHAPKLNSSLKSTLKVHNEAPGELFTLFLLLPLELQRHIWHYAVCSPRVVEIHEEDIFVPTTEERRNQEMPPPLSSTLHCFKSKTANPPLLQTCRESRMVAIKCKYRNGDLGRISRTEPVYFEFEVDIAFLSRETLKIWESSWLRRRDKYNNTPRFPRWSAAAHSMRQNLRFIAFGVEILMEQQDTKDGTRMIPSAYSCKNIVGNLFQFSALEEVILVLNDAGTITSDEMLSSIRLFQPDPNTDVTLLLQRVRDILNREYALHIKELFIRGHQRQRQRGPRGRGCILSPISSRSPPIIKCMVTKLRM